MMVPIGWSSRVVESAYSRNSWHIIRCRLYRFWCILTNRHVCIPNIQKSQYLLLSTQKTPYHIFKTVLYVATNSTTHILSSKSHCQFAYALASRESYILYHVWPLAFLTLILWLWLWLWLCDYAYTPQEAVTFYHEMFCFMALPFFRRPFTC